VETLCLNASIFARLGTIVEKGDNTALIESFGVFIKEKGNLWELSLILSYLQELHSKGAKHEDMKQILEGLFSFASSNKLEQCYTLKLLADVSEKYIFKEN
jgi:hypothetical protein